MDIGKAIRIIVQLTGVLFILGGVASIVLGVMIIASGAPLFGDLSALTAIGPLLVGVVLVATGMITMLAALPKPNRIH